MMRFLYFAAWIVSAAASGALIVQSAAGLWAILIIAPMAFFAGVGIGAFDEIVQRNKARGEPS